MDDYDPPHVAKWNAIMWIAIVFAVAGCTAIERSAPYFGPPPEYWEKCR